MVDRRNIVAMALVVMLVCASVGAGSRWRRGAPVPDGLNWVVLEHNGVDRGFGWYVGADVGSTPSPVVLVLHGGGGRASQVWSGDDGTAWKRLADEHDLVLLLPEGRSDPGNPDRHHWNDCRNTIQEPDAASDAADVEFLRATVHWAANQWPVDRNRVYVTGASNGGMMCFRMAMEAPTLIAAAAPIIANLPYPSECHGPLQAMPMLIMNGTEDPLMPWEGGCVGVSGCRRGTVLSTDESVLFWVDVNRSSPEPECTDLPDAVPGDDSTVTVCTYGDGAHGSEVVLYRVEGGGHTVPGPDNLPFWYSLIVGPKNHDISAADEIWAFFERHRRSNPEPRLPAGRR